MSLNQKLKPNKVSNTTSDPLVSPVTAEKLADYLGLDYSASDDALLNAHLLTACGWYIAHTNNELLQRNYKLKFDRYPSSDSYGGLSPVFSASDAWIDIPLTPVSSVTDCTFDDVPELFSADLDSKPPRIFTDNYGQNIVINYVAGYATADDIPSNAILGINMMAGYLFDHRGSCSIDNAAVDSGAASVWGYNAMILSL